MNQIQRRYGQVTWDGYPSLSCQASLKAAVSHKAITGVGVDGFLRRVLLELSDERCERILLLLTKGGTVKTFGNERFHSHALPAT